MTTTNFGGVGPRRRISEKVSPLDSIQNRLSILGAPDDMIDNLAYQWDNFDDEWTPETQREMVHWSDARLIAEITGILAEYHDATNEVDDQHYVQLTARRLAAGSTIPAILEWVGDDMSRALAVIAAEKQGKLRGKLIAQLEAIG